MIALWLGHCAHWHLWFTLFQSAAARQTSADEWIICYAWRFLGSAVMLASSRNVTSKSFMSVGPFLICEYLMFLVKMSLHPCLVQ